MTHRLFHWRWYSKLTRWNFSKYSLGHKILKTLSIKGWTMNRNSILECKTNRIHVRKCHKLILVLFWSFIKFIVSWRGRHGKNEQLTPSWMILLNVCSNFFFNRYDCRISIIPMNKSNRSPLSFRAGMPPGLNM